MFAAVEDNNAKPPGDVLRACEPTLLATNEFPNDLCEAATGIPAGIHVPAGMTGAVASRVVKDMFGLELCLENCPYMPAWPGAAMLVLGAVAIRPTPILGMLVNEESTHETGEASGGDILEGDVEPDVFAMPTW